MDYVQVLYTIRYNGDNYEPQRIIIANKWQFIIKNTFLNTLNI